MNFSPLILGLISIFAGHFIIWYQTNGQFINQWVQDHPWITSLMGIPASFFFIQSTKYLADNFNGNVWPGRLIGFAVGIILFTFLTKFHLNETITIKTSTTLVLATIIVLIQVFWK